MFGGNRRVARRTARRTSRRTARRVMRRTALVPGMVFRRRSLLVNGFSLLLVGGAAYKIGQAQAMQIQQQTGRPPEDLSPEELENAMEALNIDPQDLNDQDRAAIEAEAIGPGAPAAPATSPPQVTDAAVQTVAAPVPAAAPDSAPASVPAYIAELQQLAGLRDVGVITSEEFEAKKKQLLGL